ncbi:N5-carboxyaminoimidazole ribonucleotide synthase [Commensalibacter sp. Nvir]|uniref:5-(carboxyamino)imidazole ribonucleotide synthase n=1 Tax=Commensalibacter sp. Nvir TaxID=3069817 RepID=UPI002D32E96F|nr:N5-carboxyaminoimidazole ribonucleotide synthase [Commensalibacter sp. Nvir]
MFPPNSTLGIIGGGQLGRMSAIAAARLGFRTHIFSNVSCAPASQVANETTVGSYDNPEAIDRFAKAVDVITFEFENISADGLDRLASLKPVHPSGEILRTSQDRIIEKSFLNQHGIPTTSWLPIYNINDALRAGDTLSFPFLLKTTRLGYDGKGQAIVHNTDELNKIFNTLDPHPLIAEKIVNFNCEISVMVARNKLGQVTTFDVTENQHKNGILDLSFAPARIDIDLQKEAKTLAIHIANSLKLIGILGIEMFIADNGQILINEIAPRPHNSGHWTLDACPINQFEMHVRAVMGLPLPNAIRHSDAVMKNLIGPQGMRVWDSILSTQGLIGHLYGKKIAKSGRKMGHVTKLYPLHTLPGKYGSEYF